MQYADSTLNSASPIARALLTDKAEGLNAQIDGDNITATY